MTSRHPTLEKHLCQQSGAPLAEAVALLLVKVAVLGLPVMIVWAVTVEYYPDGLGGYLGFLAVLALPLLGLVWISLVLFNRLIAGRLRGAGRFRRPSRARRRAARRSASTPPVAIAPAAGSTPSSPEVTLRTTPAGQGPALRRTALLLALGLPAAALGLYVLRAHVVQLRRGLTDPFEDLWSWSAPSRLGAVGEWFFTDDLLVTKVAAVSASTLSLGAGIVLAQLMLPLLQRRGEDALDLALTREGLMVRGGFLLRWEELDEILVVRDRRMGSVVGRKEVRVVGQSRRGVNPTFIPGHSRTRIALIPWNLPEVAQRALVAGAPSCRALRVDRPLETGYLLCDLWTHSPDAVDHVVGRLRKRCSRLGVRVLEVERGVWDHALEGPTGMPGILLERD